MPYCSATEEIMYAAFDFSRNGMVLLLPKLLARIFGMQRGQLPQQLLRALILHYRSLQHDLDDLISATVFAGVEYAPLAKPEFLLVLSAGRDLQQRFAID